MDSDDRNKTDDELNSSVPPAEDEEPVADSAPQAVDAFEDEEDTLIVPPLPAAETAIMARTEALAIPGETPVAEEAAPDTPDDEDTESPRENGTESPMIPVETSAAPNSAAPPRIVGETPIGGVARLPARARPDALPQSPAPPEPPPPVAPVDPNASTTPGSVTAEDLRAMIRQETGADAADKPAAESVTPEPPPERAPDLARRLRDETERLSVDQPKTPPAAPGSVVRAEEWDEDLSPELASVLFTPPAAEAAPATPQERVTSPAAEAKAVPKPAPAAAPDALVRLTDLIDAARLPLVAKGHRAPAPDAPLEGKVRYTRLEEPHGDGQRIAETWTYLKPTFPALEGRLVREAHREEIRHADGSWEWRHERRYADKGSDRREARANPDRTYIERADEVSEVEADTGKRRTYQEEAAMILAVPEREEKRGLLSSLFGRDDEAEAGARGWREATSAESRQARKQGGAALKRGFLRR
jgi:hypothetical protein